MYGFHVHAARSPPASHRHTSTSYRCAARSLLTADRSTAQRVASSWPNDERRVPQFLHDLRRSHWHHDQALRPRRVRCHFRMRPYCCSICDESGYNSRQHADVAAHSRNMAAWEGHRVGNSRQTARPLPKGGGDMSSGGKICRNLLRLVDAASGLTGRYVWWKS
jgi:hypothetical protein